MADEGFRARLADLEARLGEARARPARSDGVNDRHLAIAGELMHRYAMIEAQVDAEEATAESHGQSVSDLEHAVRAWVKELDLDRV
jgi:hypothetical protein